MNVGILLPRSNAYPSIAFDLLDGLKTFLKKENLDKDISIYTESIGFGSTEKEVHEKAEKLLMQNDIDVLVAYIDLRVAPIIEPLMFTSGKPCIIVNPGANYPESWVAKPNILFLTLHDAFLCGLTGVNAAATTPAATASTLYDCGYLHTAAMANNFTAHGGKVVYHYVNRQQPYNKDNFEISALTSFLAQNPAVQSVLSVFDSLPASFFYSRINAFGKAEEMHLYASPMMLQPLALQELPYKFSLQGHVTWLPQLQNEKNSEFRQLLQQANKKPSLFSLLGWEVAMVLQQVYEQKGNDVHDVAETLKNIKLQSPRGALQLDEETNYFTAPAYSCSVKPGSTELVHEEIDSADAWKKFASKPLQGVSSGWTNTYLCY